MGYGGSDLFEPVHEYLFQHVAEDLMDLADHLGHEKVVLCGFSIGSSWAMNTAVCKADRVRGVMVFGTMADTGHPDMDAATLKAVGKPPAVLDPVNGCCGCVLRGAFAGGVKKNANFKLKYAFEREASLPKCATVWKEFTADPFWVCCKVDSFLGYNRADGLLGDAYRSLCMPWQFDIKKISCPMFIFQGEGDYDMGSSAPHAPEFVHKMVAGSEMTLIPGCGHVCVVGPNEASRKRMQDCVAKM